MVGKGLGSLAHQAVEPVDVGLIVNHKGIVDDDEIIDGVLLFEKKRYNVSQDKSGMVRQGPTT